MAGAREIAGVSRRGDSYPDQSLVLAVRQGKKMGAFGPHCKHFVELRRVESESLYVLKMLYLPQSQQLPSRLDLALLLAWDESRKENGAFGPPSDHIRCCTHSNECHPGRCK